MDTIFCICIPIIGNLDNSTNTTFVNKKTPAPKINILSPLCNV